MDRGKIAIWILWCVFDVIAEKIENKKYNSIWKGYNDLNEQDKYWEFEGYYLDGLFQLEEKDEYNAIVTVPVYLTIVIDELVPIEPPNNIEDKKNGRTCKTEDIRRNKIWGNYMCQTDLKWYHIKNNWLPLSEESVSTQISIVYNSNYTIKVRRLVVD